MAVSLKHAFQSAKPDGADTSIVRPSDWNAEHVLTQASGKLLGRTSAGTGATEEITAGSGLALSAGTLTADVTSVAGRTGAVTLAVADVSGAAPTASPALTGTPTAPTAASGTNTTQIATTAYVQGEGYLKAATASATYLTISTASATYAPLASPTFTGTVTLPSTTAIGSVTSTELGYLSGVTSSIQTQINAKLSTSSTTYVQQSGPTGSAYLPAGTTAQRPGSPAAGYIRYNSTTGKFEGYGSAWGNIGGGAAIGDTPPANPGAGDLWWNSADGRMYVYYTDANSSQWVDLSAGGAGQYLPLTGGTVTGNIEYIGTLTGGTGIINIGSGQFYKDASGNVGIGTSSPSKKLVVSNSGAAGVELDPFTRSATTGASLLAYNRSTASYARMDYDASEQLFFINGSERVRIDSSGNLLVGTSNTANGYKIALFPSGSFSSGIYYRSDVNNTNALDFRNPSNTQVGSIYVAASSTTFATSSDYRLKENIQPIQNALATVAQLNPVTYTWKADGSDGQGFIAHELQAVVPDCVVGEKDAVDADGNPLYQGVDTSFLVATLTKAIQELNAKVDALQTELAQLKGGE